MKTSNYQVEDSLGYWITLLARSLEGEFESILRPFNMTRIGYVILLSIENGRCNSPMEIANYLKIDRAAVTRHLDRLEKLKLIRREIDEKDKRYFKVLITKKGKTLLPKLIDASKSINKKLSRSISKKEKEQLQSMIKKVLNTNFDLPTKL